MSFISIPWLGTHVDLPANLSAEELAKSLVKVGLEEEAIHSSGIVGPLVCGKVLSLSPEKQSNGKTINYCRVDVGSFNDEPGQGAEPSDLPSRSIVCGAHNFKEGDHVAVVLPGAVLPGDFQISARKTYGHISDGMICSMRELGLGQDHDGIIVLEQYLSQRGIDVPPVGTDLLPVIGLGEEILEINITPDRGYCFSMRGVGREYSHATGASFTDRALPENLDFELNPPTDDGFPVIVDDQCPIRSRVGCDRFVTRIVRGIKADAPTPQWMIDRLESAGMRSISLAVDVTNYVMLDIGQPLHAYDLNVVSAPFVVRRAKDGQTLTTLDGIERVLNAEDLVISDTPSGAEHGSRIVGLAGVMGASLGEVSAATTDVLLEAAHFDPVSVARTARRHKIPSEAAKRFERGVDPQLPPVATAMAARLLVEYGFGVEDNAVSDHDRLPEPLVIQMPLDLPSRMLGVEYSALRVIKYLEDIGCKVDTSTDLSDSDVVSVTVPSWRSDLVGPAHLVEEVARLGGYDELPSVLAMGKSSNPVPSDLLTRRQISDTLAQAGLVEVLTYPFISADLHDKLGMDSDDPLRSALRLANPLSEDEPFLRTRLLDTLLGAAARNIARSNEQIAIFELGQVSTSAGIHPSGIPGTDQAPSKEEREALRRGMPRQPWHVAGVLVPPANRADAFGSARPWDWADAIEMSMRICATQGVDGRVQNSECAPWHPGRCAAIYGAKRGGKILGFAGQIHPRVAKLLNLPVDTCLFEVDLDLLEKVRSKSQLQVKALSTFPVAKEDLAFVVDQDTPALKVEMAIEASGGDLLEDVHLFDVYQGSSLGQNKKSLAFALRFRAPDRTLKAQELTDVRNRIIKKVEKTCKAALRE